MGPSWYTSHCGGGYHCLELPSIVDDSLLFGRFSRGFVSYSSFLIYFMKTNINFSRKDMTYHHLIVLDTVAEGKMLLEGKFIFRTSLLRLGCSVLSKGVFGGSSYIWLSS